jgi:hypothetical protein
MCSVNVEISYVVSNFMMERCGENVTISFHRVFLLERIERVWPKETQVVFCISAPHGAAAQTHAQMARMACM